METTTMPPATGDHTEYSGGAHGNETGVGAMLRTARMRLGEDLRSVAQMLCIRYPYLEAIEEGRFNELPGQTYAIGFIRAYSDHLGLDSDEVIRRYKVETATGARGQELSFPTPVPETGIPGGAIVFVGIVVAVIAYGAWYISTSENNILADLVSPVPERLTEQTEGAEQGTPSSEPAPLAETAEPAEVPIPEEPAASTEPATAETPASDPEPAEVQEEQTVEPEQAATEPSQEASTEPEAAEPEAETTAAETDLPAATEQPSEQAAAETVPTAESEPSQETVEAVETSPPASEPEQAATSETETQTAPEPIAQVEEPIAASAEDTSLQDPSTESPPTGTVQSTTAEESESSADTEISQAETADEPAPAAEPVSTSEETASAAQAESEAAPEAVATPEPPPEASALPEDAVSAEEDEGDDTPPPEEPAEDVAEEPAIQPLQEEVATATEPAPPAEAPSAETSVASTGGSRIILKAKTSSWIQVRDDAANQMLVTRLLRAGESYEVPDRPGLKLLTGNAGALEVVVDGRVAPSIGDVGVVRRGVILDAERLLAGTAVDN